MRLAEVGERSVVLLGAKVRVTLLVAAPGLFRIRAETTQAGAGSPSWAVVQDAPGAVEGRVRPSAGRVHLESNGVTLAWSLKDGAWALRAGKLTLFEGVPDVSGLVGAGARVVLRLAERESVFGLGESTGTFDKRGLARDFWNLDVLGHAPAIHPSMRSLYAAVPFAVSLRDGRAAGLFWDNAGRQSWDIGQTRPGEWRMEADHGSIDLYLFAGPGVADVLGAYTGLTGRIPMPPRWSLGYQQSRYSYETGARVEEVASEFRRRRIPCDVLYLDIHHMDGYRVFTFGKAFPDPAGMMRRLRRRGLKVVAIVDPGVKDEERFGVFRRGKAAGAFVRDGSGQADVVGEVWPGKARFPDFLSPDVRAWWGREQSALLDKGVAGIWNDMNEPANFARPDKTLPPDSVHRFGTGTARHVEVHNVYGMQMSRASWEGALAFAPETRPYVVTRSTYAGGQRWAVVWTGDTSSHWDHLRDAVQMLLNLGLSGFANCGGDVGGFLDNATPELFVRWLQFGAFTPFFRNHTNIGTVAQEPWAFGRQIESIARECIGLRYRLLPLMYGLLDEARRTGAPLMRPLLWHYQNDPVAVGRGDQFLLGRDLLVAPVLEQGARARCVYLPNEVWFDFHTGRPIEGGRHEVTEAPLERIPLFVRGGGILPMVPEAPHSEALDLRAVALNVWPGLNEGVCWYEDDGVSLGHERGDWHRRYFRLSRSGRRQVLVLEAATGGRPSRVQVWRVILHHVPAGVRVWVDGERVEVTHSLEAGLAVLDLPNSPAEMRVEWGPLSC